MGDFKKLLVWQRAHQVALATYRVTAGFPSAERYGLTSQMRRAAVSVSANIAESRGRYESRDQQRLLRIAQGSARELECHFMLAVDLHYLNPQDAEQVLTLVRDTQRMLVALIESTGSRTHVN